MVDRFLNLFDKFRLIEPGFDGNKRLEEMFTVTQINTKQNSNNYRKPQLKKLNTLDKKCIAFLKGQHVYFTKSELDEIDLY